MFELPKSTEINKQLPKKAIFEKFNPSSTERKLFDEQINRLSIIAEISPQTVNIEVAEHVTAIYIILVHMKTVECDEKNIIFLSKLIDQNMLFALQYENNIKFAAYHANTVVMSNAKPVGDWKLVLKGYNLKLTWDGLVADVANIATIEDKTLDEILILNELHKKLKKQIESLEKKAMNEKQPRRKWDLVEEINLLKAKLRGV